MLHLLACAVCCLKVPKGALLTYMHARAGTIARAVQPPVHDVTDASVLRSWLNSPLGATLEADIFKVRRPARHLVHCKDTSGFSTVPAV